jgi:hypothetical protein
MDEQVLYGGAGERVEHVDGAGAEGGVVVLGGLAVEAEGRCRG